MHGAEPAQYDVARSAEVPMLVFASALRHCITSPRIRSCWLSWASSPSVAPRQQSCPWPSSHVFTGFEPCCLKCRLASHRGVVTCDPHAPFLWNVVPRPPTRPHHPAPPRPALALPTCLPPSSSFFFGGGGGVLLFSSLRLSARPAALRHKPPALCRSPMAKARRRAKARGGPRAKRGAAPRTATGSSRPRQACPRLCPLGRAVVRRGAGPRAWARSGDGRRSFKCWSRRGRPVGAGGCSPTTTARRRRWLRSWPPPAPPGLKRLKVWWSGAETGRPGRLSLRGLKPWRKGGPSRPGGAASGVHGARGLKRKAPDVEARQLDL